MNINIASFLCFIARVDPPAFSFYHKHVGDKSKCPVVIKAHRGGALRTAELLEILNMIAPCRPGEEKTTQLLRFTVERTVGLKKGEAQSMRNLTLRKVVA